MVILKRKGENFLTKFHTLIEEIGKSIGKRSM